MLLTLISRLRDSRGGTTDYFGSPTRYMDAESGGDGFLRMGVPEKGGPENSLLTSLPGLVTMNFLVYCAIVYVVYLSFF